MGTRCIISKHKVDGYHAVYSHWDGYPEEPGVGWKLNKYYKESKKIDKLIALGGISSLGSEIGKKHDFSARDSVPEEWTTAYHRDRGDSKEIWKFKTFDKLLAFAHESWANYLYWYEKGKWHCMDLYSGRNVKL